MTRDYQHHNTNTVRPPPALQHAHTYKALLCLDYFRGTHTIHTQTDLKGSVRTDEIEDNFFPFCKSFFQLSTTRCLRDDVLTQRVEVNKGYCVSYCIRGYLISRCFGYEIFSYHQHLLTEWFVQNEFPRLCTCTWGPKRWLLCWSDRFLCITLPASHPQ